MLHLDLLVLSGKNVLRAGNRTMLCVLAICIGIASVSVILSLGLAAGNAVQGELERIGVDGVVFYPKTSDSISDEVISCLKEMENVSSVMSLAIASGNVTLRNVRTSAGILGIDESLADVFHLEVLHGTLPNAQQIRSGEKIVVIDEELAQKAYQRTNVIGKKMTVTVKGVSEKMEICAVIRSQSANISMFLGSQLPHLLYMPYTTLTEMNHTIQVDKIMISLGSKAENVIDDIQKALNQRFEGDFQYENLNQYLDSFNTIMNTISLLISGIAGISVVVGGLGVMNSMVSAVETRTREIGIYRALGAKKRNIIENFILEAILLCLAGGICGITLSVISVHLIEVFIKRQIVFQWNVMTISLGLSIICGVLFGMMPAIRAARLDPIKAIRSE
ncbi:MAG: ABC transporter permease [Lachnospiraceae bacterium]|nr:ABC transporter permease [Lachnospiraceae bacterium]